MPGYAEGGSGIAATPSVALAARGSPVSTPIDTPRLPAAGLTIAGASAGLTVAPIVEPTVGPTVAAPTNGAASAARRLLPPHNRNAPAATTAARMRERRIIEPTPGPNGSGTSITQLPS